MVSQLGIYPSLMVFTEEMQQRYARHLILPQVGQEGQERLQRARVLCVGAGGLGSPCLVYLAAAGVGHLGIIDGDRVDLSNLQRQIIHGTPDVGRPKTESARDTLLRINPLLSLDLHPHRLAADNALDLLRDYDIVVDGTDNFPARYLINDACVLLKKPFVHGSIFQFEGQATLFDPGGGNPCYRCLYREPPPPEFAPSCAEAGVLGVLPGIIGCLQAAETLKWILRAGQSLAGRLLAFNALELKFRELKLRRDPQCPVCGNHPTILQLKEYQPLCDMRNIPGSSGTHPDEVTVHDMRQALEAGDPGIQVVDIREPGECQIVSISGVQHIPLSSLAERFGELDPAKIIYLHCHRGGRSLRAVQFLKEKGYTQVKSVKGGIQAWAEEIDPSLPKY